MSAMRFALPTVWRPAGRRCRCRALRGRGTANSPASGTHELPLVTSNLGVVSGAPTLLADGRAVVVDDGPNGAGIALIKDGQHVGGRSFPGRSIVSAAASR